MAKLIFVTWGGVVKKRGRRKRRRVEVERWILFLKLIYGRR
jgi:hypothetical protein